MTTTTLMSFLLVVGAMIAVAVGGVNHDYADALKKSLLFFEGQRSGKLPATQRMTWRKDSALKDGHDIGVDLVGGYYDAGDNLKFGFPMAFTTTMLSWSIIEYGRKMGAELSHAEDAVRWATDYFLKATVEPNKVYVQVGEPYSDHDCWERPEDMDTLRSVYAIDPSRPGSEVAAETAAALAAASIVFRSSDPNYANVLLQRSLTVFDFADKYRGSYSYSLGRDVCPFYCDFNGYEDEILWAAAWIHKASNSSRHWEYMTNNMYKLDQNLLSMGEFGWDDKHAGIFVLLYREYIATNGFPSDYYHQRAVEFACTILPESPTKTVKYSPGGLLFKPGGSNMQHPTALSFLLLTLARYLVNSNRAVNCGSNIYAPPSRLIEVVKSQVDYILGNNPLGMSYMVGYSGKFPQRIHHRGSSLPSVEQHPKRISCNEGTPYFESQGPNPNLLVGALVGGPDASDAYPDSRSLFVESEPATYINAPMVGLLAYFKGDAKYISKAHG